MGFLGFSKKVDYKKLSIFELEKYLTGELSPKKVTDIVDIQYAYLDKLFFTAKTDGGFGLPETKKSEIQFSDLYSKCLSSLVYNKPLNGIYKKDGKINNVIIEFARTFFQKGLKDIRRYTTRHFDQIELQCLQLQLTGQKVELQRFYSTVLWNQGSYLFDARMYIGDIDFVCYKIKLCYQLYFEQDYSDEISLEQLFSHKTEAGLREWIEQK